MKRRILTAIAVLLCTLTLFSGGVIPAHAYAPSGGESDAVVQSEQVRWYYRIHNGEKQMRLWSMTYQEWVTDWTPVPDGWPFPET